MSKWKWEPDEMPLTWAESMRAWGITFAWIAAFALLLRWVLHG